jgi:CHASE2 domain-containing sensor protein/HD-GYP domain-containing protein (c-di-GMP phosphodiesterase class II)
MTAVNGSKYSSGYQSAGQKPARAEVLLTAHSGKTTRVLKRILRRLGGRPLLAVLLICMLVANFFSGSSSSEAARPSVVNDVLAILGQPFNAGRNLLFDGLQKVQPRTPSAQPVTIVAIDERSLRELAQWPWPRDRLAALIDEINHNGPAAIGLDFYMPEPDRTSPGQLAEQLPKKDKKVADALRAMPSHESILAKALKSSPSVLGAVGLDLEDEGGSSQLRSAALWTHGDNPLPYVEHHPRVLTSLPELQAAAMGQGLLDIDERDGVVRRIPLIAAVGDKLVSSLALEMFRVASRSKAVEVTSSQYGIRQVQVADLTAQTQSDGDVMPHFSKMRSGSNRYVSAIDVLQRRVDPAFLSGKLVLIGLTSTGLSDSRRTALGEMVPGVEIQAQVMEALFEGQLLTRPWWLKWLEALALGLIGGCLVWLLPRTNSRILAVIKFRPVLSMAVILFVDLLIVGLCLTLFSTWGVLLDGSAFVIVFTVLMGALGFSALTGSLGETRANLAQLVEIGIMLGRERNRDKLLHKTLTSAMAMAQCQAATLFLRTEHETLRFALRTNNDPLPSFELPLNDEQGKPNHAFVATYVASTGKTVVIDDVYSETRFDVSGTKKHSEESGMRVVSMLNLPLQPHDGPAIGVIQLLNAMDPQTGQIVPFSPRTVSFAEALAAQAAVAIDNRDLLLAQEVLMDSMITIIAGAIDTKSPYTGGHCERVPELAMMLAEEACKVKIGPLADFEFKTDDEWREFRIGAWLHDCGKVTTPEYVVDKATKLETIYNRIHEVRMRFEVLLRDAQVERLQSIHENGADAATADARFAAQEAQLIDDFTFVAECNLGGEFMAPNKVARLRQIAQGTWLRHFDDRLGISQDECKRFLREPAQILPVREQLLADRPHHLFDRPPNKALDEKYGFKLKVPEYLYNHGEVYNLSIGRGTLTEEERFKVNEHIIQTVVMLEQMPLPSNLKRVPEYAGTHHETLIGSGYPRKLDESTLSIPSRIMAIADIFEALTASDRPYKQSKTLSESIKILSFFKKDRHIDPCLFDLFLTSGVYKNYAERFLRPDQIDEFDIGQYVDTCATNLGRTASEH